MSDLHTDVLIIGGGPGGLLAGVTAARCWPGRRITLIRPEEKALVPCGIPYIFGTLGGIEQDLLPGPEKLQATGLDVRIGRVASVDRGQRLAVLEDGTQISWARLVVATGAEPFVPPIPGRELEGVFTIHKDYRYQDHLFREVIPKVRRLAVIGGGFIGVEFAEEIRKRGIEVDIIEMMPHLLIKAFDEDICSRVETYLQGKGIGIHTHSEVEAIVAQAGGGPVAAVRLKGGGEISADAVLIAIGVRPKVELARAMGLTLSRHGAIMVDAFQRSLDDPTVFAVGDCAQKQDFFTRREGGVLLASQAAAEGRIAGMNLYALQLLRHSVGDIAVYAGAVGDLAFGAAGMTAAAARRSGFAIVIGEAEVLDHYPAAMPDATPVHCRLVFARDSLQLLGGQILGGATTGELVNAIGFLIQTQTTAPEITSFQTGMHPRLTAASHPISEAAWNAMTQAASDGSGACGG